ncbi:DUF47 domain-containing protein [Kribbella deserti]|uniref:DUF47 domain-containing protein n=1 Tax=Kribbella deserti TaxID=1926257 RepID=A0ABV6QHL1_9ACTN
MRRFVDDLSGRAQHRAIEALAEQIGAALRGVELTARMTSGELEPAEARALMSVLEHSGDDLRAQLVAELATALTTPIDREDLYRLSRSVDDVLDNLRDLVRETDLYQVKPEPSDLEALHAIGEGLDHLQVAMRKLSRRPAEVTQSTLAARKCAGRVRQLYQAALAELFQQELSIWLLKRRELLRRLDVIGLRLGECANALSDAMLKRSH